MQLCVVLLVSLLFGDQAGATILQYTQARRDTTDTCTYFNGVSLRIDPGFWPNALQGCYCESTVVTTLAIDVGLLGQSILAEGLTVEQAVTGVDSAIVADGNHQVCTYPDNSTPACTQSNVCGYTCNTGFTLSGGECVCVAPSVELDGGCTMPGFSVDTCAYFYYGISSIIIGEEFYSNGLQGCYCMSTIAGTLMTNGFGDVITARAGIASLPEAFAAIDAAINYVPDHQLCGYPPNSAPACTESNVCGFTCINDFTLSTDGGDCICASPRVLLNGVCTPPGTSGDTCAYFDSVDLVVGSNTYAEALDGCYCISTVAATISANGLGERIVATGGLASLGAALAAIDADISSADDHEVCVYPPNSAPACTEDNVCGFTCTNHFTLSGGDCICASPRVLSNGVCAIPGSPGLRRRDAMRDSTGCAWYEDACGIPGEPSAWECLDTRSALDSCGGCIYPPPAGLVAGVQAAHRGKDCTEIPHAMEVACRSSNCVVDRCEQPYIVSADGSSCTSGDFASSPRLLLHQFRL